MKCRALKYSLSILLLTWLGAKALAASSDSIGHIPATSDIEILVAPNVLPHGTQLKATPSGDIIAFSDGICYNLLDSNDLTVIAVEEFKPQDIHWDHDGNCFISDGKSLYLYETHSNSLLELIDAKQTPTRFVAGNHNTFLFYPTDDKDLYACDFERSTATLLWHFDDRIADIECSEGGLFVGYGKRIAIITDDRQFIPLMEASNPIRAIASTEFGALFYGTEQELCYFDYNHHSMTVIKKGVVDLLYQDNTLFAIFDDYSIGVISHIDAFNELSLSFSKHKKESGISYNLNYDDEILGDCTVLAEPGELHIDARQLSIIPDHGLYLLTGDWMISIDDDNEMPIINIPPQLHPESILFTEDDVLACNDTTIVSCKSSPTVLYAFDTNKFQIWPTNDNGIFVTIETDDGSAIFICNPQDKTIKPFLKLKGTIQLIAGDTVHSVIATNDNIYIWQEGTLIDMLHYSKPIVTATLTPQGVIFSDGTKIFLLEGENSITLLAKRNCEKLLSDGNTLYVYSKDGSIASYAISLHH